VTLAVAIVAAFVLMIVPHGVSSQPEVAAHLPLLCYFAAAAANGMTSVALALPPLPAYQCNILHVAGKQKARSTSWAFVTVPHTQTDTLHVSLCFLFSSVFLWIFRPCT